MGLSNLYRVANLENRGNDIETLVALEFLRRKYEFFYYKTLSNQEIDFVVIEENRITKLIQVSKTLNAQKTKNRELDVFKKTINELNLKDVQCVVLTEDASSAIKYDNLNIDIVNIQEWLIF